MKNPLIFWLLLFISAQLPLSANSSSIIEERHQLFILGVLAYLHNQSTIDPKPGHDIAALIAWDVENINKTPEFVLDRNRNFEKQGNIFHAEMMTIEKAAWKEFDSSIDPLQPAEKQYSRRLANATLYSSLEPCPLCTMGITMARIPKAIYFMEDPGLRDSKTYSPLFSFPNEFLGKKIPLFISSSLPLAEKVNQELREMLLQNHYGKYAVTLPDGQTVFDFRCYFEEELKRLLKLGHELFSSYEILHKENRELYNNIAKAIGFSS